MTSFFFVTFFALRLSQRSMKNSRSETIAGSCLMDTLFSLFRLARVGRQGQPPSGGGIRAITESAGLLELFESALDCRVLRNSL